MLDFYRIFEALTGHCPLRWQQRLYDSFVRGIVPPTCAIPTGLGKTSVIPIWLIALATKPNCLPRRLVYVVNRRTVVDQATREAEKLRTRLLKNPTLLRFEPPAISTLRGQFADNREWSIDPSRPAVVVGTVDMVGSRLLFSGYGLGFKSRPLHAGFLGQDALIIHDEAHLEPAFQELIETIKAEQDRSREFANFHVMEMTATTRNHEASEAVFGLLDEDIEDPIVKKRVTATKRLTLAPAADDKRVAQCIVSLALKHKDSGTAVLVFARTIDDVNTIYTGLADTEKGVGPDHVERLTGTMRGLERDRMADPRQPNASRVFASFLTPPKPDASEDELWKTQPMSNETVYLVCTSAGEVGIDISAGHMVCDLSTLESMAQRFGRVNRYGDRDDTRIDVVYPDKFGDKLAPQRQATLQLLRELNGDASPRALTELRQRTDLPCIIKDAFAPKPVIPPATDILFDAWALTSIRARMPGRPPVEPYLHGIAEWQPPETQVAWREEVEVITGELLDKYSLADLADLLDAYPLKPHELLRDCSDRILKQLSLLAQRHADKPVWVIDGQGAIEVTSLKQLAEQKDRINGCTVLLPPSAGGLSKKDGMLEGNSDWANDVADIPSPSAVERVRIWSDDIEYKRKTTGMRRVQRIKFDDQECDDQVKRPTWDWFERLPLEGGRAAKNAVTWDTHTGDVIRCAEQIVNGLSLPAKIADAVILAAKLHDCGKCRERFQTALGNRNYPQLLLAKSGRHGGKLDKLFRHRHEFVSTLDARDDAAVMSLDDETRDLVLHLIAAHHGRARPHFGPNEAFDPDRPQSDADSMAIETIQRFARLQRRYGRWGLAYIESLLRAADWAASAAPSATAEEPEDQP